MLPHGVKLSNELDKAKRDMKSLRKRNGDLNTSVDFLESTIDGCSQNV